MTWRAATAVGMLALGLACSGLGSSEDVEAALGPVCDVLPPVGVPPDLRLVATDAPPVELEEGVLLVARPEGLWIDAQPTTGAGARRSAEELLAGARQRAEMVGGSLDYQLYADVEATAEVVARALEVLAEAGATEVTLVARSGAAVELPPFPVPELAEEMRAELGHAAPEHRAMTVARALSSEISLCPPAQQAFEAVAHAAPGMRCQLLTRGMAEALPSCPLTRADRVLTLARLAVEPGEPMRPTAKRVALDPDGEALEVPPDTPWAELWPQVGDRLWIATR